MKQLLTAIVMTALVPGFAAAQSALDRLPKLAEVAPKAVQISPHVPNMGKHWAIKSNLPLGPIYCEIDGRIVCVEYMLDAKDLAAGKDWLRLAPGIETPPISHIDIEFKPNGVKPHPVPLYQVHIYFVGHDVLHKH